MGEPNSPSHRFPLSIMNEKAVKVNGDSGLCLICNMLVQKIPLTYFRYRYAYNVGCNRLIPKCSWTSFNCSNIEDGLESMKGKPATLANIAGKSSLAGMKRRQEAIFPKNK